MTASAPQAPATLRVGMAQMRVDAAQPEANLRRAVGRIAQAAQAGCDLVVLPECLDIGWGDQRARELAQPIPGKHMQRLAAAAREHRIFVAAGLVERWGGLLFNAAVLLGDEGRLCLLHRKIHELDAVVGGLYRVGDRLGVAHTRLGVVGLAICADLAPQALAIGHVLARMGAQIIVAPSAWAVPCDHDQLALPYGALWLGSYGELAAQHGLPVVGTSSVGRLESGAWRGWPVIGASLAMRGDGTVAARGGYGESADELIVCTLALRP